MDMNTILARSQQRVVQFATMVASKPSLNRKEHDKVRDFLTEADPELFQLVEDVVQPPGAKAPLLSMTRQYSVGNMVIKAPSFVFVPEGVTITQVVSFGSVKTGGDGTLQNSVLNKRMQEFLVKIQELVKGLRFTRAGKTFEFNLGPFAPTEKKEILQGILARPDEITTIQGMIGKVVKGSKEDLNVATMLQFQQADPTQPFLIQLRVDINNRILGNNMDGRSIGQIFTDADAAIQEHLESLFGAGQS